MKTKNSMKNINTSNMLTPKQMGKIIGGDPQPIDFIVK